jgi:hypothetical protein
MAASPFLDPDEHPTPTRTAGCRQASTLAWGLTVMSSRPMGVDAPLGRRAPPSLGRSSLRMPTLTRAGILADSAGQLGL